MSDNDATNKSKQPPQDSPDEGELKKLGLKKAIEALQAALNEGDPELVGIDPRDDALNVTVKPKEVEGPPVTLQLRVMSAVLVPGHDLYHRRRARYLKRRGAIESRDKTELA